MASAIKKIRSISTFFIPEQSLRHLMLIRQYELEIATNLMPTSGRLLEVGAGVGWQASKLAERGYDVSAIDIATSNLKTYQIWPVIDYDGKKIPFADNTFDIVFSSNVLEHISEVRAFQRELQRVLSLHGIVIHIVPSGTWRYWTNFTHVLKYWSLPRTHGLHASNALNEIYFFSRRYWKYFFENTGWQVISYKKNRLFYTGSSVIDQYLSIKLRHLMSYLLGSSCHIFVLKPLKTKKGETSKNN